MKASSRLLSYLEFCDSPKCFTPRSNEIRPFHNRIRRPPDSLPAYSRLDHLFLVWLELPVSFLVQESRVAPSCLSYAVYFPFLGFQKINSLSTTHKSAVLLSTQHLESPSPGRLLSSLTLICLQAFTYMPFLFHFSLLNCSDFVKSLVESMKFKLILNRSPQNKNLLQERKN